MDHSRDQARPATLVRRTQTTTRVSIKELVKPEVIPPVGVEVKHIIPPVDTPPAIITPGKKMLQPVLDLLRNMSQMHVLARSHRTLDLQILPKEEIKPLQGLNQQEIDTQPDRPTPVAVTPKQTAVRVAGDVAYLEDLAVDLHRVGVFLMILRQRPDTMRTQKLILIEHPLQNLDQPLLIDQRQQNPIAFTPLPDTVHRPLRNITLIRHEPLYPLLERWQPVDQLRFQRQRRVERN